jgi:hypothetical protein
MTLNEIHYCSSVLDSIKIHVYCIFVIRVATPKIILKIQQAMTLIQIIYMPKI